MKALETRTPRRPLRWPDIVYTLQDILIEIDTPAYIVGGAVRDAYLHRPISDIDLATPEDAIGLGRQIAKRLNADFFVLDRERDVARVLIAPPPDSTSRQIIIDVTRFRGADLLADLSDRDFTFNAMAADLLGNVSLLIDPLNGEQDLSDHVLRGCSPESIHRDPIRGLRAVRQGIQFKARIAPDLLRDIRRAGHRIPETSPERIRDELFKLLNGPTPATALRIVDTVGLLQYIIPEAKTLHDSDTWHVTLAAIEKLDGILHTISPARTDQTAAVFDLGMIVMAMDHFRPQLQQHILHEWPSERPHRALLMLAAILHSGPDKSLHTAVRAKALHLSTGEIKRITVAVANYHIAITHTDWSDLDMHRFWRRLGETGVDACLLGMAVYLGEAGTELNQDEWILLLDRIGKLLHAYYNRYEEIVAPPPLLDGHQLMESLDLHPGPEIGILLDLIREGQVTGDIASKEDALSVARDYLTNRSDT